MSNVRAVRNNIALKLVQTVFHAVKNECMIRCRIFKAEVKIIKTLVTHWQVGIHLKDNTVRRFKRHK